MKREPDEAMPELRGEAVNDWITGPYLSRQIQKTDVAPIMVRQRFQTDDLVGHVTQFDNHGWTKPVLPAKAREEQRVQGGKSVAWLSTFGVELLASRLDAMMILSPQLPTHSRASMGPKAM